MPPHAGNENGFDEVALEPTGPFNAQPEKQKLFLTNRRKVVQFKDTVTYREILPLSEISDEEMAEVWYNEDEYAEIKNHVTDTIKRVTDGDSVDECNGYCMRGLEGRTKFGARRRKNNKAKALDSVWTTQVKMWKKRIDNPLLIAAAYKPHSTNAKYPAIAVAHDDEMFVQQFIRERQSAATR
ncbi:hypothetical protein IV203_034903 [Nitzschia inconspicua]|uniref:Uncharacterized protein n=1 Tax=Nitzschia inconspicua TaxID=303405 RepID=A0A9K3LDI3_9STRA|nr:hypothetical protein IV203_034903 [Nitzschia inconspicua]